jgi:type II secretory pathway pseudopilin PulG
MKTALPGGHLPKTKAFSLVEVVLALGVISFALVTIMGLFGVGLTIDKESSDKTQAADLAALILSMRRALPTTNDSTLPLPPLTNTTAVTSNSAPVAVAINGTTITNNVPISDIYDLNYRISPGSATNMVNVYLLLWWPAGTKPPIGNASSYYEISTEVAH